ncbi:hypothetical protein BGZ59_006839 [Podila verticillata]|nr:hypothetical protein BGZ59_006839 [Podila verticillata]
MNCNFKDTSLARSLPTGPPSTTKPSSTHELITPRDQDVEMEGIHPEKASSTSGQAASKNESNDTISHSSEEDDDLELSSPSSGSDGGDDEDEDDGDEEEDDEEDEEEADDDNEGDDPESRTNRSKEEAEGEGDDEDDEDDDDGDEDDALSIQREGRDHSEICRWKDCGKILSSVEELVLHVSDEHIGWKKDSYTCEWQECDKSFSRSDAMAKHLKCQHSDVPERFTGRKSRGRYTMKDPAASSTLLRRNGHGAGSEVEERSSAAGGGKKRRHGSPSSSTSLLLQQKPAKIRKIGRLDSDLSNQSDSFQRNYRRNHTDMAILRQLSLRKSKHNRRHQSGDDESHEEREGPEDNDAEDSDFAHDNGQTPKVRYGILKAKFRYIYNERELLESEYEDLKRKLSRLKVERELLIDALAASKEEYQDPALEDFEDSD